MLPKHLDANDNTACFFVFFNKCMLNYLFGEYATAEECRNKATARQTAVLAKLENTSLNFFDSLLSIAIYRNSSGKRHEELLARVATNQAVLKRWSDDAPMNFLHKYYLVEAERATVAGNIVEAREYFDKAIHGAAENGYLNDESLANELAGEFFLGLNFEEMGDKYLKEAFSVYQQWGAISKMKHLSQKHPGRFTYHQARMESENEQSTRYDYFDMLSVMKSAAAIQGEISLSKLLRKLMAVLIQNAGADRGCLLLAENGPKLILQAEQGLDSKSDSTVLQAIPVEESEAVPVSVVNYVARTLLAVVINANSCEDDMFGQDRYVISHAPKSIVCLPIMLAGKLIAAVYLENRLVSGAFTEERTNLLNLLSGQIAVSIHNAIMFDNLEQKVAERTVELEQRNFEVEKQKRKVEVEKARSDELLLNILPKHTADELRRNNKTKARRYENVTVLFSDIVNFSKMSEAQSPEDLVAELDQYFGAMDEIVQAFGLEKIKTIGDAYLAVGGLPVADPEVPSK